MTTANNLGSANPLKLLMMLCTCGFIASCSAGPSIDFDQSLTKAAVAKVDFTELSFYVERADAAYDVPEQIKRNYPHTIRVHTLEAVDVLYFLEKDSAARHQTISVRGTAGRSNILQDFETTLIPDEILGVSLHRGFKDDAQAIFEDVLPHLNKSMPIRLTGHSLGAAVASILAGYLEAEGHKISRVVTFGQPKFATHPLSPSVVAVTTRVANGPDIVAMIPPTSLFGGYRHFEEEVILRKEKEYIFLTSHDAARLSIGVFWRNMSRLSFRNHQIEAYAANIDGKVRNGAKQVLLRIGVPP